MLALLWLVMLLVEFAGTRKKDSLMTPILHPNGGFFYIRVRIWLISVNQVQPLSGGGTIDPASNSFSVDCSVNDSCYVHLVEALTFDRTVAWIPKPILLWIYPSGQVVEMYRKVRYSRK